MPGMKYNHRTYAVLAAAHTARDLLTARGNIWGREDRQANCTCTTGHGRCRAAHAFGIVTDHYRELLGCALRCVTRKRLVTNGKFEEAVVC